MADLDARIILSGTPLPSVGDMRDQRQQREIQQQEIDLRRQDILMRRDQMREQARLRSMPPPVDEDKEFKLRLSKAKTLAQLLKGADADSYPVVRGIAQQLVGDDVLDDLPEQFDPVRVAALAKLGDEQIAKTVESFTLSPGSKRFDASGKVIAEVPAAERAAAAQGFTLAPGGRRYDADGNLVASAPERPAGSGGGGNEPVVAIIGPDGKTPVYVLRSQAVGKTPAPSTTARETSEDERKSAGFYTQMQSAIKTMEEVESKLTENELYQIQSLPQEDLVGRLNRNQLSENAKRYLRAFEQFTEARLRPVSGAAISDSEFARDRRTYARQYAETPTLAEERRNARRQSLGTLKTRAGRAFSEPEGGGKESAGGGEWVDAGNGLRVRRKAK